MQRIDFKPDFFFEIERLMVTHRSITNVFFPALNSANEFLWVVAMSTRSPTQDRGNVPIGFVGE